MPKLTVETPEKPASTVGVAVPAVDPTTIPARAPVVALPGVVLFPKITVPLLVTDPAARAAIAAAEAGDHLAAFVAVRDGKEAEKGSGRMFTVGTLCRIRETVKLPDDTVRLIMEGVERVRLTNLKETEGHWDAALTALPAPHDGKNDQVEALMYSVINQFKEVAGMGAPIPFDVMLVVMNLTDPWQLGDLVALNIEFKTEEKQQILEAATAQEKLEHVSAALARQLHVLKLSKKIQDDTGKELGKMEREMFLREQLHSIEKELGVSGGKSEFEELEKKIATCGMSAAAKAIAEKELGRLKSMPSFSPEISYVRTYLDWLVGLPWSVKTESTIDIKAAERILDEDHYGLEKVKERILDYLAVQKMVGKVRGPILCFAGPPGTGKTSIGKSIARSLGRKFVRMSLGGVRDEAEIRGFRRTYVGALPGRIIQGIAESGARNPVFMLDELDKLSADFRGDPSSALLEALDPEQNNAFSDHYLEVPFDLSDVLFIATANMLDTIPPALRDRLEVIEFPGYTEDEKVHIVRQYLVPKAFANHGISEKNLHLTDPAIRAIIRHYTREAGVRNVERELSTICRKVARRLTTGKKDAVTVGATELKNYLGVERFHSLMSEKTDEVGVVNGLAWTEAGGEILRIEAARMQGSGKLTLTGHLGQVMQESAQAAYSYARSQAKKRGVTDPFYKDSDIHVHVPSGAIPKDGPSAGVALALALTSLISGTPIRHNVAMTGEVTLTGRVLEIGGLKEKVLAAHRSGIATVILPHENEKDLGDIPPEVRKSMRFVLAKTMDDVFAAALAPAVRAKTRRHSKAA